VLRRLINTARSGLGKTERRVVTAIVVTALVPLLVQLFVGRTIIARISATAFQPEFEAHLEQSLGVYADLAKSIKREFHAEGRALAIELGSKARGPAPNLATTLDRGLEADMTAHPSLVSIEVRVGDAPPLARRARAAPVDEAKERTLTVEEEIPLADPALDPLTMTATFATPRARFDELEAAQEFAQAYKQLAQEHREENLVAPYFRANLIILALTILLAICAGVLVVRPVTRRIGRLAEATLPVARGDLTVRFEDPTQDEVGNLARSFNRMLEELDQSRARIEFLRRMGEWQKVARRLAHEIKNPLTPILLAVEECHRRYTGEDAAYKRIVQTTLEVVGEEVASLRRLVGEFSSFARLPKADLHEGDLGEFLRDQRVHFAPDHAKDSAEETSLLRRVDIAFVVSEEPMPVLLDREMLHRVLGNLLKNAAEALRDANRAPRDSLTLGRVEVTSRVDGDAFVIDVDDDGPGLASEVIEQIFDPYVTTKRDGTGLGLSIVKKIVVDHGGTIDASASPAGGARFRIRIPRAGTAASRAARERAEADAQSESLPPSIPPGRSGKPPRLTV
jgi:nitrogen fixation/metabolism regulation signal transduction histidine kinase